MATWNDAMYIRDPMFFVHRSYVKSLEELYGMGNDTGVIQKLEQIHNKLEAMRTSGGIPFYFQLMISAMETCISKGQDYAIPTDRMSNFKQAAEFGRNFFSNPHIDPKVIFVHLLGIKFARLSNLIENNQEPNNESITDTFKDIINYVALWAEYHETQKSSGEK